MPEVRQAPRACPVSATSDRKARAIANRTGITPGPNSPLLEVSGRTCRSEDAEGALCDSLIRQLSGRSGVVQLSQKRESMLTEGLPDRRYRVCGAALFWEVKAEDGKLTAAQHAFLLDELQHGALAACGTLTDLYAMIEILRRAQAGEGEIAPASACAYLVAKWAERGYRSEPRRRRRRRR
jgi:hypothetical protein